MWGLLIAELALTFIALCMGSLHYMHMLQLESYQLDGYLRHLKRYKEEWNGWTLATGLACFAAQIVLPIVFTMFTGERTNSAITAHVIIMVACAISVAYNVWRDLSAPKKKPLVFTKRVKRLCAAQAAAIAFILALLTLILSYTDEERGLRLMRISPMTLIAALPWLMLAGGYLAQPIENHINHGFFLQAQAALAARKDMIKIGITGSYGKTGTKFALSTILSVKYKVFTSQSSVNTPMGLSKLINTQLKPEHQVFVAEMGARHVGDIKELCELVKPTIGLITSVGPQHLETFGNVETVAKTKNELIQALPKDGTGIFASDGAWVDKLYKRCACEKLLSGVGEGEYDLRADNISVGASGSRFTLISRDGESVECETKLLGRHNISNLVLSCLAAKKLGLSMEEIARGVSLVKPVEHRLQLIPGELNVIDDAFNSNPVGAREALSVLAAFPGRHLIITPGFVEMGEDEDRFNYQLGRQIASACDAAILVGPRHTKPILQGLLKEGFDESRILTVASLDEASAHIRDFVGRGDAVLFENDLPDNYKE